uniref:Maturation n=2 Tax=Leviviricetes TaxID=2842243 RepID=A0A514D280_9VIRU|nr:MAG: hypothetical protein H2RhizoLitter491905_000003 [Leviviridae sp.]
MGRFFPSIRRRARLTHSVPCEYWRSVNIPSSPKIPLTATNFYSQEEIIGISHKTPIDGVGDSGGFMTLTRTSDADSLGWGYCYGTSGYLSYRGGIYPTNPAAVSWWTPSSLGSTPGQGSLNSAGATAIARCKPTSPHFSLAQSLGELREGAPSIPGVRSWENRTRPLLGSAGDEYLNIQFGWLPLISDARKFYESATQSDRILSEYRRNANRKIRRGYDFPVTTTTRQGSGSIQLTPSVFGLFAPGTISETVTTRRWFRGAFRYYLPSSDSFQDKVRRKAQEANQLFGVIPTPEVFWELTPWSWAIDWFTNVGDVMSNVSSFATDGLVLQYGYIMEHRVVRGDMVVTVPSSQVREYGLDRSVFTRSYVYEYKVRYPANPYGFGIDDSTLTKRQLSILGALGLSKGTRER